MTEYNKYYKEIYEINEAHETVWDIFDAEDLLVDIPLEEGEWFDPRDDEDYLIID